MPVNKIKSITEYHKLWSLPKPSHPLVSVIDLQTMVQLPDDKPTSIVLDFYAIALKKNLNCKMSYGQQEYDFDEGTMFFISPGQVYSVQADSALTHTGWSLLIHPDFFWKTSLARAINKYEYFSYAVNEALYLSEREEELITAVLKNIEQEYQSNIDKYTQPLMLSHIYLLLNYADRFYNRQFITRAISNNKILNRLETILNDYFEQERMIEKGLPTVLEIAGLLNISPSYLSGLLKSLTGQSTQQFIHDKLIEKAKEKLSTTELSVSEIAYELGFEHPQSFSKLFKTKTNSTPLKFRQSFG